MRTTTKPTQPVVTILWGAGCEEATAAIFLSVLRQAGVMAKLVGIGPPISQGCYGVKLAPDVPIRRVLHWAQQVCCVIIPCGGAMLQHFCYDPDLVEFLQVAQQQEALLVMGGQATDQPVGPLGQPPLCYPAAESLWTFAQQLALRLAAR